MAKYKLSKDKKTITKSDYEFSFKWQDAKEHYQKLEKMVTEKEAQKKLEETKINNYEKHHPEIKEMEDEKKNVVSLYWKSQCMIKDLDEMLKTLKKALKEYEDELKEINKQTKENLCLK